MKKIVLLIFIILGGFFCRFPLERIIIGPLVKTKPEGILVKTFYDDCVVNYPTAESIQSDEKLRNWKTINSDKKKLKRTPNEVIVDTWSTDIPQTMVLFTSHDIWPTNGKVNTCTVGMGGINSLYVFSSLLSTLNLSSPSAQSIENVDNISVLKYNWSTTIQGKPITIGIKFLIGRQLSNAYLVSAIPTEN